MFFLKILIFFLIFFSFPSKASLLEEIKNRGILYCGIAEPTIGFADIDDNNNWKGFDIDFCKAIASAIFGDSSKVEYITTTSRSRFPILASKEVDLLSRMTTWSFSRDVNLEFEFTGINFYDGQGFMVQTDLNIDSALDLDGSTICIVEGSSFAYNINNFFKKNNLIFKPIAVEFDDEAFENFISNRCDVYSDYLTELAKKRATLPNSRNYNILSELISKEPLSPLVRQDDDQWRDVVSWTINVLILAEELGISSENIDDFNESENNEILRLLGNVGSYGDMIELDEKWVYNIIKQVGNYGEIYNRNLGPNTLFNLKRGLNNLYTNGGLLYAPPYR